MRNQRISIWGCVAALVVLVFGALCLNYTNAFGFEHHREVATKHGWPEPSYAIFIAGVIIEAIGGVTVGFFLGRARRTAAAIPSPSYY